VMSIPVPTIICNSKTYHEPEVRGEEWSYYQLGLRKVTH